VSWATQFPDWKQKYSSNPTGGLFEAPGLPQKSCEAPAKPKRKPNQKENQKKYVRTRTPKEIQKENQMKYVRKRKPNEICSPVQQGRSVAAL
jgi:DNA-nicking Smr family endonuclease